MDITILEFLYCQNNLLTSLDIYLLTYLSILNCENNHISYISFLPTNLTTITIINNPLPNDLINIIEDNNITIEDKNAEIMTYNEMMDYSIRDSLIKLKPKIPFETIPKITQYIHNISGGKTKKHTTNKKKHRKKTEKRT